MTSTRLQTHSATSISSRTTTESPQLNQSESDTVLIATRLSNVSLAEREERQQALDRLEINNVKMQIKYLFPEKKERLSFAYVLKAR